MDRSRHGPNPTYRALALLLAGGALLVLALLLPVNVGAIPRALLAEGFAAQKGGAPSPLVGTVKGFPKALYSVHWAPGGQGFAVACGDGAYVLDLNLPHGGADWVGGKKADLSVTVRPPAAP